MSTLIRDATVPRSAEVPPDPRLFERNLAALSRRNERLAERLRASVSPGDDRLRFMVAEDGVLTAEYEGRLLASRRRPMEESERLAQTLDAKEHGAAVVLGFGLGYHVRRLLEKMGDVGVVGVFEPDVPLLRAVLERVDHSGWLGAGTLGVFTDADDAAQVTLGVQGWEAPLAVGVQIIEHAPSRPRLGELASRFASVLSGVVGTVRTHVITTMMQTDVTARNGLMNADHYARWPGVGDLAGLAAGRPAIIVSAGPSLRRNIDALKRPGLRDRCVIIAVQTVLRQLLNEGIRPHFVTALDYHEISSRFYEGLTARCVEGVTLVAEPKANPAILDAFPGPRRLIGDAFVETVLGDECAGRHATLRPGATVAHLAYYLARHLGADPVILVGQDLAFTDGQYYARGAAIHRVWSGELNAFNTLEMMEWQRIVRMRGNLHELRDHLDRPVYSDDQMVAYLRQFERDFMQDARRGLTTIDATEGGVAKAHSVRLPLREAIERFCTSGAPLPAIPIPEAGPLPGGLTKRLHELRLDVRKVARLSRETRDLLGKLAQRLDDAAKADALVRQIHALRDRVQSLDPAYALVHRLNQTGTFNRFKADRALALDGALTDEQRQRRRVERDSMNVGWLADSADVLDDLLGATIDALKGGPKRTRDVTPPQESDPGRRAGAATNEPAATIGAVLTLDTSLPPDTGAGRVVLGRPALRWTLERLGRCRMLRRVVIVTDDADRARMMVGGPVIGLDIEFLHHDLTGWRERRRAVTSARAWAGSSWRGGIAGMTAFDEAFDPSLLGEVMRDAGLTAAVIADADWCCIDPALTDAVIGRYAEHLRPDGGAVHPITFTQAPPGLAPCVLPISMVGELARGRAENSVLASVAGVLGYRPMNPRADLIASTCCVEVPPGVRDAGARFVPDDASWWAFERVLGESGAGCVEAGAPELCALMQRAEAAAEPPMRELVLVIGGQGTWMERETVLRAISEAGERFPGVRVTLSGDALGGYDPLAHPSLVGVLEHARRAGVGALHVRTALAGMSDRLGELVPALVERADVISVDCYANTAETYRRITGRDGFADVLDGVDRLLTARRAVGGLLVPFVVPRITRRDAVYAEIDAFFDKSLLVAGWCVIDQLPSPIAGERIEPLGKPGMVARRDRRSRMVVDPAGHVYADERAAWGGSSARPIADLRETEAGEAWTRLIAHRERAASEHGESHPDLWTGW